VGIFNTNLASTRSTDYLASIIVASRVQDLRGTRYKGWTPLSCRISNGGLVFLLELVIGLSATEVIWGRAHEVVQLDVSMDEPLLVEGLNAIEHLEGYFEHSLLLEVATLAFIHQPHNIRPEQLCHNEVAIVLPINSTV
jgi:hypothetical protein